MVLVRLRQFQLSGHCCRKLKDSGLEVGVAGNADFYLLICQGSFSSRGDLGFTHAQSNIAHGMCVDGNGNRRKPGSEASVGCNEERTWGSSDSCQPSSGTPTPGGRIL